MQKRLSQWRLPAWPPPWGRVEPEKNSGGPKETSKALSHLVVGRGEVPVEDSSLVDLARIDEEPKQFWTRVST